MRRGVTTLLAVLALIGSPARAEDHAAVAQDRTGPVAPTLAAAEAVPLDEIVVTGSKSESRAWDSTVPTQVIPEEVIRETTTIDVQNVLGEVPGLYVRRNEQFALGASTVACRGWTPTRWPS